MVCLRNSTWLSAKLWEALFVSTSTRFPKLAHDSRIYTSGYAEEAAPGSVPILAGYAVSVLATRIVALMFSMVSRSEFATQMGDKQEKGRSVSRRV